MRGVWGIPAPGRAWQGAGGFSHVSFYIFVAQMLTPALAAWQPCGGSDLPQLCSLGTAAPHKLPVQLGQDWGSLCAFLWEKMIPQGKCSFYHGDFQKILSAGSLQPSGGLWLAQEPEHI